MKVGVRFSTFMERTGVSPEGIAKFVRSVQVTNTYKYEGYPISFSNTDGLMVNATEMAKPFGKEAKHWLINQATKDFIEELANVRNLTFADLV